MLDRELNEELQFHFDQQVQANLERHDARARARPPIAIGNPDPIREASRDGRAGAWLRQFGRDLSFGVRLLLKAPGFSAAAIAIIALGVGAVTAIFSVVYGVALKPLPFREPDRLVNIYSTSVETGSVRLPVNGADHRDWLASNHVFEDIAPIAPGEFQPHGRWRTRAARGSNLGEPVPSPAARRRLAAASPRKKTKSATNSCVTGRRLWRRRFAADRSIVGKPITLNGVRTRSWVSWGRISAPAREFQAWTPSQSVRAS
jgi:hypothetical protein